MTSACPPYAPRRHRSVEPLRAVRALSVRAPRVMAFVLLGLMVAPLGCSRQGAGERCDIRNRNKDCESGLVCVPASKLEAIEVGAVCCPSSDQESVDVCIGSAGFADAGSFGDQNSPPSGGNADGGSSPASNTDSGTSPASTTDSGTSAPPATTDSGTSAPTVDAGDAG